MSILLDVVVVLLQQPNPSPLENTQTDARTTPTLILTAEMDTSSPPLRYLLVQNHINVSLGEQQRGHGGVQLIFHISASRSTIAQPVDLPVLCNLFLAVQLY